MASLVHFKLVEISSSISFRGIKRKRLKYRVRSIALESFPKAPEEERYRIPEIFWQ